ncbi:envelope-like protein [Trifolium medium]|uniref:Envelope-like protein n=1 Tax=Trifolium medium TaxID=97028 RepID=A0A392MA70_9FABA|nr:envelope-like protein [Trifolium medium]
MSNITESSPIKDQITVTPSKLRATRSKSKEESSAIVANAVPITTIHAEDVKKKKTKSSAVKKEKSSKLSDSSPSRSIKIPCSSSKKNKSQSAVKKPLTMTDLYLKPLNPSNVESDVDAYVKDSVVSNVEASVKSTETPDPKNPKSTENLGQSVLKTVDNVNVVMALANVADTPEEESEYESAIGNEKSQDKVVTGDEEEVSDEDTDVNSQADEEGSMSVDKTVSAEKEIVDVDDLDSMDQPLEQSLGPSIAKRLRNRKGNDVPSASVPAKTTKKTTGVGPKKKKTLKRKEVPTSDSDYDVEPDVPHIVPSTRKKIAGKNVPLNVPAAPMDNVSFISEVCVQQETSSGERAWARSP